MIQIYLHSDNPGFLDLMPNSILSMESLENSFDDELILGEYSLPLDIPWTDNNKKIFGFFEQFENQSNRKNWFTCDVFDNGYPELVNAKITILQKIGKFSYKSGKFSASISGTKGIFGSVIANKKLTDLNLGGTIIWVTKDSREFAKAHANGEYPNYPFISFVPVAFENYFDKNRNDYDNEFLVKDCCNNVVITGTGLNDWVFGRPNPSNPNVAISPTNEGYIDYRTIPFLKLQYVLRCLFEENGFKVFGDFINDHDFDNLLLFNNKSIENYAVGSNVDVNKKIILNTHVPDLTQKDFLKSILYFFGLYAIFSDGNQVKLVYHQSDLDNKSIINLDEFCSPNFESTIPDLTDAANGYKINYTWDGADQYYGDRVKDLTNKNIIANIDKRSDLVTVNIGRTLTTDDIVFVAADNMYYQVADATSTPIKWDAFSENLTPLQVGTGDKAFDLKLSTLCSYVELNPSTHLYEKRNYVGTRQLGSYRTNKGIDVTNTFGLRIFYGKKLTINGVSIPVSYNHNRDENNVKIESFSLALNTDEGIAIQLHQQWINLTNNNEIIKIECSCNQKILNYLRDNNTFIVNGNQFILQKIERDIPISSQMIIYLMPI